LSSLLRISTFFSLLLTRRARIKNFFAARLEINPLGTVNVSKTFFFRQRLPFTPCLRSAEFFFCSSTKQNRVNGRCLPADCSAAPQIRIFSRAAFYSERKLNLRAQTCNFSRRFHTKHTVCRREI
jgi:hypothetical protein